MKKDAIISLCLDFGYNPDDSSIQLYEAGIIHSGKAEQVNNMIVENTYSFYDSASSQQFIAFQGADSFKQVPEYISRHLFGGFPANLVQKTKQSLETSFIEMFQSCSSEVPEHRNFSSEKARRELTYGHEIYCIYERYLNSILSEQADHASVINGNGNYYPLVINKVFFHYLLKKTASSCQPKTELINLQADNWISLIKQTTDENTSYILKPTNDSLGKNIIIGTSQEIIEQIKKSTKLPKYMLLQSISPAKTISIEGKPHRATGRVFLGITITGENVEIKNLGGSWKCANLPVTSHASVDNIVSRGFKEKCNVLYDETDEINITAALEALKPLFLLIHQQSYNSLLMQMANDDNEPVWAEYARGKLSYFMTPGKEVADMQIPTKSSKIIKNIFLQKFYPNNYFYELIFDYILLRNPNFMELFAEVVK